MLAELFDKKVIYQEIIAATVFSYSEKTSAII